MPSLPATDGSSTMHYELLSQGDIFLAFAGRSRDHERVNAAIQNLATGDALQLVPTERGVFFQDASGVQLGALSKAAAPGAEHRERVVDYAIDEMAVGGRPDWSSHAWPPPSWNRSRTAPSRRRRLQPAPG